MVAHVVSLASAKVPILCYLAVEHGIVHSLSKFVETFVTGSPFFFMFHMGTKAHYCEQGFWLARAGPPPLHRVSYFGCV